MTSKPQYPLILLVFVVSGLSAAQLSAASTSLSLEEALDRISRRLGFKAGAVIMPFAEAAVDVDSVSDLELVKKIVAEKRK